MRQNKLNRLRQLGNFLMNLPPKKFNLGYWKNLYEHGANKCGMTACAIGWDCALHPRSKLKLQVDVWGGAKEFYPEFKNFTYEDAIKNFYGMTSEEVNYIFMPDKYPKDHRGPKSVGRRILKFVEKKEKEKSRA